MQKKSLLIAATSLMVAFSSLALAQPPAAAPQLPPIFDYTCPGGQTPELAIEKFFDNSWSPAAAARMVEGADPQSPALKEFSRTIRDHLGQFQIAPLNITIAFDPKNPDSATAQYELVLYDELGHTIMQDDGVTLKKHVSRTCTYWMILPGQPEDVDNTFYRNGKPTKESGMTTLLATEIAYPEKMQTQFHLSKSENNVKQISLGLMQYVEDYDQQIHLNPQNYEDGLMPYIQSEALFTAPGDAPGTVSYDINPNLEGLNVQSIQKPSELVAIYQGHNQKLDFKYNGYSVVGFMDGHVKAVSAEEAKNLRWKP